MSAESGAPGMDLQMLKLVIELGSFGVIAWIVLFWLPRAFGSLERLSTAFIADSKAHREEGRADMNKLREEYRTEFREERLRFIAAIDTQRKDFTDVLSAHTKELEALRNKLT